MHKDEPELCNSTAEEAVTYTKEEKAGKRKLTKTEVEALSHPEQGQRLYFDSELKGFGVRVTPNAKAYFAESRVDGKTVRVKLGRHGELTAEEARKKAKQLLGSMAGGSNPNKLKKEAKAKSVTLKEVFEEYCEKRNLRPKTLQVYSSALNRCLADWLDKPVITITKTMVEKRHKELSNTEGKRSNKGGAKNQANQTMRVLRSLLNFAGNNYENSQGLSIIPENPVKRLSTEKSWNKNTRRQTVIHAHQLKPWMDAVEALSIKTDGKEISIKDERGAQMSDYLMFCLFTGLRRGEAAGLRWDCVDLEAKYLKVASEESKNHEEHRLPLSSFLFDLLSKRKAEAPAGSIYVFPGTSKDGRLLIDKHFVESKRGVAKVCKTSGVKFSMHDLRRTFITIAEGLDFSYYVLKRLSNHKTSADVTSGYIVSDVERLREPMQRVTDRILQCAGRLDQPDTEATAKAKPVKLTDSHVRLSIAN